MSRVIAGTAKGHRLNAPSHSRTRPTSDLVRESAFNLIADWAGTMGEPSAQMLDRFSFLDLYGGTGAVACEAASRGAGPVVCVEKDRATAALARGNAESLGLDVTVMASSVDAYLATPATRFDVVWLDPPYDVASDVVSRQVEALVEGGWLADDGLVIVERSRRSEPITWPPRLTTTWSKRYGETTLFLATKEDA